LKIKKIMLIAFLCILTMGTALPIYADNGGGLLAPTPKVTEVIAGITPIGVVEINKKSYFELKQPSILTGNQDKTAVFTVTVHNGDDNEIEFIDYWIRLTNKTGAKFNINLMPEDLGKNRIAPHSSLDFHFYAKINSATELNDLKFRFFKWDFSLNTYERSLGEIIIPVAYSELTPVKVKRIIPVLGTDLKTAVTRVEMTKNDKNYLVTVYYSIENVGLKSLKLPNFIFDIHTSEGYIYPLDANEVKELVLAPRMKKEVHLEAVIPLDVIAKDWKLFITKEDPTVAILPVASYALPQFTDDTSTGDLNSTKVINISEIAVNTDIVRASISKTETDSLINIFFSFTNTGASAVVLPEYSFSLKTKEDLVYPLTAAGLAKTSLNPKESKEFQLAASIPLSVDIEGLELRLLQPNSLAATKSFDYPIATYKVPESTAREVSMGTLYPYTNKYSSYTAQLNSIQRVPWDDQDILSAEISIGNSGASSALPPKLQGYYLLDGKVKLAAKLLEMDNVLSIPSEGSAGYVLLSKIPYTAQFTELKLILEEKVSETETVTIAEFIHNADLIAVPTIAKGEGYKLMNSGKNSELKVGNLYTYKGAANDLVYIEVDMKNLEKRFAPASKLTAYLKSKDDLYYPATISTIEQKISPGGKGVLAVQSELPKGTSALDLDLMIGLAVTSGEGAKATNDGYIRVAQMKLPVEDAAVKASMDGLSIRPYTIGLSNFIINGGPSSSSFDINFDYTLSKSSNPAPDSTSNPHKLVIEVTDGLSNINEKTFDLDSAKGLKLGKGSQTLQINFANLTKGIDFINSISSTRSYSIKIYDEYQGFRRLLSSSKESWFPAY
jgi:hypothetical protein